MSQYSTIKKIILVTIAFITMVSCGAKKNTSASRGYQAMVTRFNVMFNGKQSYDEGIQKIRDAHKEDYSKIIPMYPISVHTNAASGLSSMNLAIEKSQKAIRLHSIQKKPKKDPKRMHDPKYIAFMNQEEYNKYIDDAWLLLGKSQFHTADFLAAVSSFTYVVRHYAHDENSVTEAKIWMARAYAEMGWFYEAEDIIYKLNEVEMPRYLSILYACVVADLNLKQGNYKNAIPYLEIAVEEERDKYQRARFSYILAQLYKESGEKEKAQEFFERVIKMHPNYEMQFNAKIESAEVSNGENSDDMLKDLQKMAKDDKNKDYLDRIHYAIANIYKQQGNEEKAIENYKLAVEKSTRNGYEKAAALCVLGDMLYDKKEYAEAQVYYEEAEMISDANYKNYEHIYQRATSLNELVGYQNEVALQDSLLRLASMSEQDRNRVIDNLIREVRLEEQREYERLRIEEERAKREEMRLQGENATNLGVGNIAGIAGDNSWYFYNPNLVRQGKSDFIRKFGTRKLEDNWQRRNKISMGFDSQTIAELESQGDTTAIAALDNKKPEFYLQQIPFSEEQQKAANLSIANSLFGMGTVYYDKIEDYPLSEEAFEELLRRYPNYEKKPEVYYYLNQNGTKTNDKALENSYKTKLIAEYPNSQYARMLSSSNKTISDIKKNDNAIVDSIYQETYKAYLDGKYQQVIKNTEYVSKQYPDAELMPKFLFVKALSTARSVPRDEFKAELKNIIEQYPTSDVVSLSKNMVALMEQGMNPEANGSPNSLMARREAATAISEDEYIENLSKAGFVSDPTLPHRFVFMVEDSITDMNKLLFEVASYNFTRFLIKDFDLETKKIGQSIRTLSVTPLENLEEATWYQSQITASAEIKQVLKDSKYLGFVIAEDNYTQLTDSDAVDKYLKFYLENKFIVDKNDMIEIQSQTGYVDENTQFDNSAKISQGNTIPTAQTGPIKPKQTSAEIEDELKLIMAEDEANKPTQPQTEPVASTTKKEVKGFVYEENAPLYFVVLLNKDVDISSIKTSIETFNKNNSGLGTIKLTEDTYGNYNMLINGELPNVLSARSYMSKLMAEKTIWSSIPRTAYRTCIISKENISRLKAQNNLTVYFEFMKEMYFK